MNDTQVESRLEAWARWCADTINVSPMIGYPRESPEQRAGMGSRPTGLAICRDDEAQVESVVACIAQRSRIHAEVLRVEYGASSGCSLGHSVGVCEGVCFALGLRTHLITPQKWKKYFGLSSDKEQARARAIELWPSAELHLKRHADRAEALLMARYLWSIE